MTAEERAKAVVALLKSDFGQSGDDVWFYAIRDELRSHANAALEKAAQVADQMECEFDLPDGVSKRRGETARIIATAIRTLREGE